MNKKLFLKGLLLETTIIALALIIISIDSLIESVYFFFALPTLIILIYLCKKYITFKDVDDIVDSLLNKYGNKKTDK